MLSYILYAAEKGQSIPPTCVEGNDLNIIDVDTFDGGSVMRILVAEDMANIKPCAWAVEGQGDVLVWDADQPKPKMILADMDSTIVTSETLDDLAAFFDIQDEVAAITERAMRGEMDFHEALNARVAMLKDLPEERIYDLLPEITVSDGAADLISAARAKGVKAYLVSSGFTHVTSYICEQLGFDGHFGNQFEISDGKLTGRVIEPIQDKDAKLRVLNELCAKHDLSPAEVLTIGDGANDIPMLQAAGYGVAYKAKPRVNEAVNMRLQNSDLSTLFYLL